MNANKNTGAYERLEVGVANLVPFTRGLLRGLVVEGIPWAIEELQERLEHRRNRAAQELSETALDNVIAMPPVQRLGRSALEGREAA
ncbi:MAG: hypothetical protein AAB436_02650 [Patescibacteria group bacterium]